MTVSRAARALEEGLDWGSRKVLLTGNDRSLQASLAGDMGISPNVASSVKACRRPIWLFFRRNFPLTIDTDSSRLSSFATSLSARFDEKVRDARLSIGKGDQVTVVPEKPGWALDFAKFEAKFAGGARLEAIPSTLELPYVETSPTIFARELEAYLPLEKVAAFETYYADGNDRASNIALACVSLSEVTVGPGQTFSFNQTVGPRTSDRGYLKAPTFVGDETVDDYGGGVCQVSTTVYVSLLKAGFTVAERYCHAKPVDYVPMGFDATVVFDYLDLKMTNTGAAPCLLRVVASSGRLLAEVFARPVEGLRIEIESRVLKEFPAETVPSVQTQPGTGPAQPGSQPGTPAPAPAPEKKLRSGFLVETLRKWVRDGRLEKVERLDTSMYPAEKAKER